MIDLALAQFDTLAPATGIGAFVARNWALLSIATTLAVLIVIPTLILRKYTRIAINLMDDFSPPVWPEARDATHDRHEGVHVDFVAFDGHSLRGTVLPSAMGRRTKGMIVFAHEFGSDRFSHTQYSRPLRDAGFDVFVFDFRGHGESPGEDGYKPRQFPSDREQADMLGAIAFIEDYLEQKGRPVNVGLFGLSRGGGAALLAAAGIDSVRAIAVDGGFSSDAVLEYLAKRWARIFAKLRLYYETPPPSYWRFVRWLILTNAQRRFGCRYPSVRKVLGRLSGKPLFFIHGERDTYIPYEQTQMLYGLSDEPKHLWVVPGARHNHSVIKEPEAYAQRIVGFFNDYLAGDSRSFDPQAVLVDLAQPIETEWQHPRHTEPVPTVRSTR